MPWGNPQDEDVGRLAFVGSRRKPVEVISVHRDYRVGLGMCTCYKVRYVDSGVERVIATHKESLVFIESPLAMLGLVGDDE